MQTLHSFVNTHTGPQKGGTQKRVQRTGGHTNITGLNCYARLPQRVACFLIISMLKKQIPESLTEEIFF